MRKLMNMIVLSCRKATELNEKQMHCRLAKSERVQFKMHLFLCKYCSRYVRQVQLIDMAADKLVHQDTSELEAKVIQQLRGNN